MKKIIAALVLALMPAVALADTGPQVFTVPHLQYFVDGIGSEFIFNGHLSGGPFIGGTCVQANHDGFEELASAPCAHVEHGSQTITGSAGVCVPGTPVVFNIPFVSPPDITFGTEPIVGDSGSYSSKTNIGFIPNLCGTAGISDTINWIATGT